MKTIHLLVVGSLSALAACVESRLERAGTGAASSAGMGVAAGFVCCGNPG